MSAKMKCVHSWTNFDQCSTRVGIPPPRCVSSGYTARGQWQGLPQFTQQPLLQGTQNLMLEGARHLWCFAAATTSITPGSWWGSRVSPESESGKCF